MRRDRSVPEQRSNFARNPKRNVRHPNKPSPQTQANLGRTGNKRKEQTKSRQAFSQNRCCRDIDSFESRFELRMLRITRKTGIQEKINKKRTFPFRRLLSSSAVYSPCTDERSRKFKIQENEKEKGYVSEQFKGKNNGTRDS